MSHTSQAQPRASGEPAMKAAKQSAVLEERNRLAGEGRHDARAADEDGEYGGTKKHFTTSHDVFSNVSGLLLKR
jgi:hypothetical protein